MPAGQTKNQTKNKSALEFMLPIPLVPLMERYLDVYRPVLLGTTVPALPLSGGKTGAL